MTLILEDVTGPITVQQAFDTLELLGYKHDYIRMGRQQQRKTVTELKVWLTACGILDEPASSVPLVSFVGGPPNQQEWFTGSLRTYVLDRIMAEETLGDERELLNALSRDYIKGRAAKVRQARKLFNIPDIQSV